MGGMHGDWTSEPFMHPPHQHLPQQHLPLPLQQQHLPPPPQQQQHHPPHQHLPQQHLPQQGPGQPGLQQQVQRPSQHQQQPPEQQHQAQSLGKLHHHQQQQQAPFVGHQLGAGRRERFREVLQPVADPLILRCLECFEREEQQRSLGRSGWGAATLRDWIASLVQGKV